MIVIDSNLCLLRAGRADNTFAVLSLNKVTVLTNNCFKPYKLIIKAIIMG